MLINLDPGYVIRGRETYAPGHRVEPIHTSDTVSAGIYIADVLGCAAAVDADSTALNYDTVRTHDGRSRVGTVRAWVSVWTMPGVAA